MKKFLAILKIIFGLIYIINPGSGIFEIIPDNIPIFGNLDEAGAVLLMLNGLKDLNIKIPFINK